MVAARFYHTATLLPGGDVLVAGGVGGASGDRGSALASAELFDPGSGRWVTTGRMVEARDSHTATLLSDGKVLVTGGVDSQGVPIASAEVFDPQSGQWTAVGPLTQALGDHTATLLPN